jgi:hypothetical protein
MRILVTGSRRLGDYTLVYQVLNAICEEYDLNCVPDEHGNTLPDPNKVTIVVGDCPTGADLFAREWAFGSSLVPEVGVADWSGGKRGGPERNQRMVDSGVDLCVAFPLGESKGTHNCMKAARRAGVPVWVFEEGTGGVVELPKDPRPAGRH